MLLKSGSVRLWLLPAGSSMFGPPIGCQAYLDSLVGIRMPDHRHIYWWASKKICDQPLSAHLCVSWSTLMYE